MNDALVFSLIRRLKQRWTRKQAGLSQAEVDEINAVLHASGKPDTPKPSDSLQSVRGPLVAIVGAVAATSLFATVPQEEGTQLRAYRDVVGIWTICQGDTNNVQPGMLETPEGCRQRLEAQLVAHAAPVMACSPRLKEEGRDYQRAAAVSLAYNIGVRAYCHSTVDKRFDAGDFAGACDAFLAWRFAGGREIRGLALRRQRERIICMKDLT